MEPNLIDQLTDYVLLWLSNDKALQDKCLKWDRSASISDLVDAYLSPPYLPRGPKDEILTIALAWVNWGFIEKHFAELRADIEADGNRQVY